MTIGMKAIINSFSMTDIPNNKKLLMPAPWLPYLALNLN